MNGQNISGPLSDSECGKGLLSPPGNFSGSALQDSITLTWSNNEYAGQYKLYRDGSAIYTGTELTCLLYTSPSPRDRTRSRMPSSA